MATIKRTLQINAPLDRIVDIAFDPKRWVEWFDGLASVDAISGQGQPGTVMRATYGIAGMKLSVTSKVLEASRSAESARWIGEFEGALSGTHTWDYTAKGSSTDLSYTMEYTVPGNFLGQLLDRIVIESMQEKASDRTLANLKNLSEKV